MTLAETVRIALGGIVANKLRSGLTILGMTIGVASVIVLVAVGNGSKQQVQAGIQALGSNVLLVQAGGARGGPGAFGGGGGSSITLTQGDATALQDPFNAPDVKSASPVVAASSTTLVAGSLSYASSVTGTTPAYATARNYEVASGAMFTAADVKHHDRVVVLGPTVVENLFSGADPVGQTIKMGGSSFTVVGVTKAKGSNGTTDQDDVVFAPLTAVQDALSGYGSINQIVVQAKSEQALNAAQAEVTSILDTRHDISATDTTTAPFHVINQGSILETSDQTTSVFTTLLGAVAAISLLVGGIGVMNIMLVSVTERTREIGIRKAIGARRADILWQFLAEAVLVSMLGGVVGVVVGVVGSRFQIAGVQPVIALYSIPLSFGAAVLAGLFFGTYPAGRAARLRPIDALRFE
ncbi:Macrolide export ATP-binding/permease protein MacB [Baekduia alba]|uniref:ABC transporter permease n=1 Tax=Baekduia alba TaxID=2997333 RepID=UPI0023424A8D|nr:ABC transporter permease [Baekduia alba]WCB92939.1 Macrolide export ATP-binding/permease protein MacB [Baekduia alba]